MTVTVSAIGLGRDEIFMQPGDRCELPSGGTLVYYTPEEATHIRGLLKLRQEEHQRIMKFVEERVRKELEPK